MKIKENLDIKTYDDYQKNKVEIFNIISDTVDMCIDEMLRKNPTFLIPYYDKLVEINELKLGDRVIQFSVKE